MMNILGIHAYSHDANAALLTDGQLLAFHEEERLSRVKHDNGFPHLAIKKCLEANNLTIKDIDIVAIDMLSHMEKKTCDAIRNLGYDKEIVKVRHHDSHAAATYYASGFDEAAVLIVDGHGSTAEEVYQEDVHYLHKEGEYTKYELQSFYSGRGNKLRLIHRTVGNEGYRNGIGILYTLASRLIGFGEFGAGKVMGLSSFGEETDVFTKEILKVYEGRDIVFEGPESITADMEYYQNKYFNSIGQRKQEELPCKIYNDLAYKVQVELEKAMITLSNYLYDITGCKNLCLGGGVALNGLANMRILEETPFENIYIFPATSDTGTSVGNALYVWNVIMENENKLSFVNAYWGQNYTDKEVKEALSIYEGQVRVTKLDEVFDTAAELLQKGDILGWFQGRSEVGPRALGNRSILGDPRKTWMKDKINAQVKHREAFRPFAPSVMEEHCDEYFHLDQKSPYMLLMAKVREKKRNIVPSIVHVDGTARVQTVNQQQNKRYYKLLNSFFKKTGVPMLLNTSFNVAGQPIVETPRDAIDCFMSTGIDKLIIHDYLVEKVNVC